MATAYWNNRAILRQAAYDRANNQTVATVTKAYDRAMNQLDIDIDKIMATYTRKTGLTARDAYAFLRDGVPPGVMDDLRARAAAITDKAQAKQLGVMLRTDAYRARISRLDAIKASTRVGLSEAAEAELRAITPHLRHTADLAYSRTMFDIQKVTAGFEMVGVPRKALDTILKSRWSGMNYAQSVWANRDAMAGILDRALMEQASMGKLSQITFDNVRGIVDSKAWADKVAAGMKSKFKSEMQYSKYAANRLIRTESAYVAGQTTAVAYDECEIEKYEFMATLDNRTSSICSSKDGEIYVTKDKEVGVNWPPLHPHCRSTTAPVIDGLVREGLTRAARDKDGKSVYVPRDMKYNEWAEWQKDGAPADIQAWRWKRTSKPETKKFNQITGNQGARDIFGKTDGMKYNATLDDEYVLTGKYAGKVVKVPPNDTPDTYIYSAPRSSGFLNHEYVSDNNKNTILTNGRVVLNDDTFNNDARIKLNSMFDNEFNILGGVRKEGVFYRTTGNEKEIGYLKSGKIRPSKNHMTGKIEDGLSVWEAPKYSNKITYKVKGDVMGIGSDGEPILDIKTLEFIEEVNSKDLYRMQEEGRKKFAELYDWTDEQIDKALKWNVKKKDLDV